MVLFFALTALGAGPSGINNPGGDRIPYVKLQSDDWDIVIRMTGEGRARVERMKAQCKNKLWVNGCASGVDPELRQIAMNGAFQDAIKLSGDFTYCSTAVMRDIPAEMARGVVRASPEQFCRAFLDPESVRDLRSGNATQGENDLVNKLMGGRNTTSGKIRMKAPPTLQGEAGGERTATGERRTALQTENNRRKSSKDTSADQLAAVAPVPEVRKERGKERVSAEPPAEVEDERTAAASPRVPAPATSSGIDDSDDWFELPAGAEPVEETGMRSSTDVGQAAAASPRLERQGGGSSAMSGTASSPEIARGQDLLAGDDEDDDIFNMPEDEPPPPMTQADRELAALLAPIPGVDEEDQVVVPAPRPAKTHNREFAELAAEDAALARLSRGADEDDKKKKKKKETVEVGTDDDLGDYIIIDIESLPEE